VSAFRGVNSVNRAAVNRAAVNRAAVNRAAFNRAAFNRAAFNRAAFNRNFNNRFWGRSWWGPGWGWGWGWGWPWWGWGWGGWGWGGWGWGWPSYGLFGFGSGYGDGGYGDFYPDMDYSNAWSAYTANPGVNLNQAIPEGPAPEQLPPADQPGPGVATIRVVVPTADAVVTFDGAPTQQRGTERVFQTPPLEPGQEFTYTVTATWVENGQKMSREDRVTVRPRSGTTVNFGAGSR
jgi:uncharacterized protein (TIGR03000 family)